MKYATAKMRPPLKWHGGKAYLARRIIGLFLEHRTYCEPFIGGGSVLLNKPRSELEVAGDLNAELIGFWRAVRNRGGQLLEGLSSIPYTAESFERAKAVDCSPSEFYRAEAFLIRNRMSRGGLGKDFAWSDRLRGGKPGDANAWDTIRAELPAIADRVKDVEFHHADAFDLIRRHDGPGTLIYCDPPYLLETRTARKAYAVEATASGSIQHDREWHRSLLIALKGCRSAVYLSGYPSELYDRELAGWRRHEFDMPNHSSQARTKQRRVEVVWANQGA